ncbi:DUF4136 domain-containing protein [Novosphingobium sp. 9]|uniref:DUF4136 domain-containing protein n=1 Tax=Novosphingobium sp. 9 TaxID=2025349 RepID=UPI0021B53BC4|nr:DUF4136 domain-containing protein [Novosphingobium sp. 9]
MRQGILVATTAALAATLLAGGCAAPVGPVSVTRFHVTPAPIARGAIRVVPGPGMDAQSIEYRDYATALARELNAVGYTSGDGGQVAILTLERETALPAPRRSPVSVGLGGSTGSYGSGMGMGIGINLAGRPKPAVATRLHVFIRQNADGPTVWEGRASFVVRGDSPLATTSLGAAKMAQALLKGFPGNSGETIEVK